MNEPTKERTSSCGAEIIGFLQDCLVEGNRAALVRSRRLRRQALLISLFLQAAVLAGLILQPLVATGERPAPLRLTPMPPWYGLPHTATPSTPGSSGPHHSAANRPDLIYRPPQIPHSVPSPGVGSGRRDASGGDESIGFGFPEGSLPPLGNNPAGPGPVIPAPVAPPAEHERRIIRPTDIQEAMLVHRVQPVYPPLALRARVEGRVQLHAIIGRDGTVNALEVISGHPLLVRAAREAVSQWRYRPTLLSGEPVGVETYVTVIFQLQR